MARIEILCPHCGKHVFTESEKKFGPKLLIKKLSCGHFVTEKLVASVTKPGFKKLCLTCKVQIGAKHELDHLGHIVIEVPLKRDHLWHNIEGFQRFFDYQQRGIEFLEQANFKALIGDEMSLGKTLQAIGALRYNYEALRPALVVCPASLIFNWQKEFKVWFNDKYRELEDAPMIHMNSTAGLLEDQHIHIISSAIIAKEEVLNSIQNYGFKTLIMDESHQFKNDGSNRTDALIQLAEGIPFRICLSGTPIMNRVMEFFNTLHLIKPEHWPHKGHLSQIMEKAPNGAALCIKPRWRDWFFDRTSPYIIRRKKEDVYRDLPEKLVAHQFIDVTGEEKWVNMYNDTLDELDALLNKTRSDVAKNAMFMQVLALITRLREIAGLAKIRPTVARVKEFLENTDPTDKITIGVHHVMAREKLMQLLAEFDPISISDEPAKIKDQKQELFKQPDRRILVASIIGAGTGRNIQFCHNALCMEREWNPAIEKQFQDRFHRPIKCLTCDILTIRTNGHYKCPRCGDEQEITHVILDYLNAKNTIDEFFHNLVELKEQITQGTLDKDFSTDIRFIYELAEKTVSSRLKFTRGMAA